MTPADLPGGDLIEAGLDDLRQHRRSVAALLVSIGAPRLRRLGLCVPRTEAEPERCLYELLARSDPDSAHGFWFQGCVNSSIACCKSAGAILGPRDHWVESLHLEDAASAVVAAPRCMRWHTSSWRIAVSAMPGRRAARVIW